MLMFQYGELSVLQLQENLLAEMSATENCLPILYEISGLLGTGNNIKHCRRLFWNDNDGCVHHKSFVYNTFLAFLTFSLETKTNFNCNTDFSLIMMYICNFDCKQNIYADKI